MIIRSLITTSVLLTALVACTDAITPSSSLRPSTLTLPVCCTPSLFAATSSASGSDPVQLSRLSRGDSAPLEADPIRELAALQTVDSPSLADAHMHGLERAFTASARD